MNDSEIREELFYCDRALADPEWWLADGETAISDLIKIETGKRIKLKEAQLAMWIETYGAAE